MAALRAQGVDWLAPTDARLDEPLDDESLIGSLAVHPDPRLRQALIALFLLQPHLAPLAPKVRARLEAKAGRELAAYYLAAVYLQRMWRIRLERFLQPAADLPDYFWEELALPAPADEHGRAGLVALAEWHAGHSPHRPNHLSAYEGVADLLFESLKLRRRSREFAAER